MKHISPFTLFESSTEDFNMKIGKKPENLVNAFDAVLLEPEDIKKNNLGTLVNLPPSKELWTQQEFISDTKLKGNLSKEPPILIEDSKGRWWVADGHHRIVDARTKKKSINVLLLNMEDVDKINSMW